MNTNSFYEYALQFTISIADLVADNRKLLLMYIGFRSYMSLKAIHHLSTFVVRVYELLSLISGKSQSCNIWVFKCFKKRLNKSVNNESIRLQRDGIDVLHFFSLLCRAYERGLIESNITCAFKRSKMCTLNGSRLMNTPRPSDSEEDTLWWAWRSWRKSAC